MNATLTRHITIALVLLAVVALPRAGSAQYRLPSIVSANKADSLQDSAVRFVHTGRCRTPHVSIAAQRSSAQSRIPSDFVV